MKKGDRVRLINRKTGQPLRGHDSKLATGVLSIVSSHKITVHHEGGSITMVQGMRDPIIKLELVDAPNIGNTVTFRGWARDYVISNPAPYITRIEHQLAIDRQFRSYKIGRDAIVGESITHMVNELRLDRCRVPGRYGDQVRMFEALGYRVIEAVNNRGQKCMIVTRKE